MPAAASVERRALIVALGAEVRARDYTCAIPNGFFDPWSPDETYPLPLHFSPLSLGMVRREQNGPIDC